MMFIHLKCIFLALMLITCIACGGDDSATQQLLLKIISNPNNEYIYGYYVCYDDCTDTSGYLVIEDPTTSESFDLYMPWDIPFTDYKYGVDVNLQTGLYLLDYMGWGSDSYWNENTIRINVLGDIWLMTKQ